MSDPVWMKFVRWPHCDHCDSRGFFVDPKTNWPTECKRCENGRKDAIKNAQNHTRRELKAGRNV